jgi:pyridoxamine 5'-phosphate oxidase
MSTPETRKDAAERRLPAYYDDLDASLAHAWGMIEGGAADRRAAFHTPAIATVDGSGAPTQRIMVLRAADCAARTMRLHTDVRGEKLAHIARRPRVSLLFYDPQAKLQLRVAGEARVHAGDGVAREAWAASRPQSRLCYEQTQAPGQPIDRPFPELPVDMRFAQSDDGEKNFAVLMVTADRIEWLYLAIEGHRRARWAWAAGAWQGTWLAP